MAGAVACELCWQGWYLIYQCHSLHFLMYAAAMQGHRSAALAAAEELIHILPRSVLEDTTYFEGLGVGTATATSWLESFIGQILHIHIRCELCSIPPMNEQVWRLGNHPWACAFWCAFGTGNCRRESRIVCCDYSVSALCSWRCMHLTCRLTVHSGACSAGG